VSLFAPLATAYSQELDNFLMRTQGMCGMSKREFYGLFKLAFERAFNEANIRSGWMQTGLSPFNPSKVLDQLATQQKPTPLDPASRPATSSSRKQSTISLSD
jgi:hypothetical protein